MVRRTILVIAVGLLGVAAAAGVTYAADRLTSQSIGLAEAPASAGDDLAPSALVPSDGAAGPRSGTTTSPMTPGTLPQPTGFASPGAPASPSAGSGAAEAPGGVSTGGDDSHGADGDHDDD